MATTEGPTAEGPVSTVLVVEDRREVLDVLQRTLSDNGYSVITADDGDSGLQMALDHQPDLVILDIGLPKRSGLHVARELRNRAFTAPVLMLTARDTVTDKTVEIVNRGRYPYWGDTRHQAFTEPYTKAQIDALRALLAQLRNDLPNLRWIAGHEDLDRRLEPAKNDPKVMLPRRQDPGPLFPWNEVLLGSSLERLTPLPASEAKD